VEDSKKMTILETLVLVTVVLGLVIFKAKYG
jgi:hypothetical protein